MDFKILFCWPITNDICFLVKMKKCWRNNIYLSFCWIFPAVLENGFSSALPALEYVFPLAVSFFKGWTEVSLSLCSAANSVLIILIFENRKEMKEKYWKLLAVLEYALPFYRILSEEWWEQNWQRFEMLWQFFK